MFVQHTQQQQQEEEDDDEGLTLMWAEAPALIILQLLLGLLITSVWARENPAASRCVWRAKHVSWNSESNQSVLKTPPTPRPEIAPEPSLFCRMNIRKGQISAWVLRLRRRLTEASATVMSPVILLCFCVDEQQYLCVWDSFFSLDSVTVHLSSSRS